MRTFVFYVEGLACELHIKGIDEKHARKRLWEEALMPHERDKVVSIDCIAVRDEKRDLLPKEREKRLLWVLERIMEDLPKNRDWLDPSVEREAEQLLAEQLVEAHYCAFGGYYRPYSEHVCSCCMPNKGSYDIVIPRNRMWKEPSEND